MVLVLAMRFEDRIPLDVEYEKRRLENVPEAMKAVFATKFPVVKQAL